MSNFNMGKRQHSTENKWTKIPKLELDEDEKENTPPPPKLSILLTKANTTHCLKDSTNVIPNCKPTTPKKNSAHIIEEPVTPNTNFKLLTTLAASLDYVIPGSPKTSRQTKIKTENEASPGYDSTPEVVIKKSKRKEKSLAVVCEKFLSFYPQYPQMPIVVTLDEASSRLGVERRRIYDIVNVLESIEMLVKTGKNQYLWMGRSNLLNTLENLQGIGLKEEVLTKLNTATSCSCVTPFCKIEVKSPDENEFMTVSNPLCKSKWESKKENTLGALSRRFLMLFLVSPSKLIRLDIAATVLKEYSEPTNVFECRTKIRRLYDVANVLSSIGLIQKVSTMSMKGKKPAFKYIGPDLPAIVGVPPEHDEFCQERIEVMESSPLIKSALGKKSRMLIRHSSFQDVCAVAEMERKKLVFDETPNSAPPFDTKQLNTLKALSETGTSFVSRCNKTRDSTPVKNGITSSSCNEILPQPANQALMKILSPPNGAPVITAPVNVAPIVNFVSSTNPKTNNVVRPKLFILYMPKEPEKTFIDNKIQLAQAINVSAGQYNAIIQQSNNASVKQTVFEPERLDQAVPSKINCNNSSKCIKIEPQLSKSHEMQSNSIAPLLLSKDQLLEFQNSNSSPLLSPISIPSGYATPVPTGTSNISFPSTSEVKDILATIENGQANSSKSFLPENFSNLVTTGCKAPPQLATINLIDTCSNDSTNLEVASILHGRNLNLYNKPYLIDEKTVLSPIIKSEEIETILPSNKSCITDSDLIPKPRDSVTVLNFSQFPRLNSVNVLHSDSYNKHS